MTSKELEITWGKTGSWSAFLVALSSGNSSFFFKALARFLISITNHDPQSNHNPTWLPASWWSPGSPSASLLDDDRSAKDGSCTHPCSIEIQIFSNICLARRSVKVSGFCWGLGDFLLLEEVGAGSRWKVWNPWDPPSVDAEHNHRKRECGRKLWERWKADEMRIVFLFFRPCNASAQSSCASILPSGDKIKWW